MGPAEEMAERGGWGSSWAPRRGQRYTFLSTNKTSPRDPPEGQGRGGQRIKCRQGEDIRVYTHFNFSLGAKRAQNVGTSPGHAVKPQHDCLTLLRLQFSESRHSYLFCLGLPLQRLEECLAYSDKDIFGLTMLPIPFHPQFYRAKRMLTKKMMRPFPQVTFTETVIREEAHLGKA